MNKYLQQRQEQFELFKYDFTFDKWRFITKGTKAELNKIVDKDYKRFYEYAKRLKIRHFKLKYEIR